MGASGGLVEVALMAAVADNGVIGRDNALPWHLPGDLRYFKQTTMGKPVLMGRKTWDSIGGKPLPGRLNIVMSRQPDLVAEGARVVDDLESALALAGAEATPGEAQELMVLGGAGIYRLALPQAKRLYITEVHVEAEGDTRFPDWNPEEWREVSRQRHPADDANPCDYSFVVYERA